MISSGHKIRFYEREHEMRNTVNTTNITNTQKMSIEKGLLLRALKVMKKVPLDSRYQPIYDNAIFGKDDSIYMLSGVSDFEELELQIKFPSGHTEIGHESFLLPVKLFDSLCSTSEKEKKGSISFVDFQSSKDKLSVDIRLDEITTKIKVQDIEGYACGVMQEFSEEEKFVIADVSAFVEALKYTKIAICDDIARE